MDPTILCYALVGIALLVLVTMIVIVYRIASRRSRAVRRYRREIYRLQQAAERERKAAAAACLNDVYRLTRKG